MKERKSTELSLLLVAPVPPPYGGIGNWVLLLRQYLRNIENVKLLDVLSISPKQRDLDGRTWWDRVVRQGFEMLKINRTLKRRIKTEHPDVIHMTTSGQLAAIRDILLLKTAKRMNVPAIYHIRFGRIPEISAKNPMEWKLLRLAVNSASMTMAIDEKTYWALKEHCPHANICKVPNPFDNAAVAAMPAAADKGEKLKLMFLGWCVKTKGVEELLTAWAIIRKKFPEWELELVGPCKDDYKQYLTGKFSMEQVVMTGEKSHEEALALMQNAEVFILPSYTEGFPNAVLEAMALGKPIVASDVGAIGEMLAEKCGMVIRPQNCEDIVAALNKLLPDKDLQNTLGKNAQAHLLRDYAIDKVVKQYEKIWREAAL